MMPRRPDGVNAIPGKVSRRGPHSETKFFHANARDDFRP
jgi:hypothetical protein